MKIKYWLSLVALLCLSKPALAAHSGSAPMEPYPTSDERFLVDTDTGLDTGCTGRDGSPLVFSVKIDRYVGNVKGDGTLANPQQLIEQGVISRNLELVMPAYDIDLAQGEVDEVYFNGHKLDKPLQGTDGTWYENQFSVPIEWVKFPTARGTVGSDGNMKKPVAADNVISIDIDTRGEGWCAAIDWAQVHFKAMAPLLLIHGIGANPRAAWEIEPGVTEYLTSLGIPFEHKILIGPINSIFPDPRRGLPGNAQILEQQIRDAANSFGVQKVHIVGHSKGGLDSRGYLSKYYHPDQVRVLSLHTISTPNQGSVLSDISTAIRTKVLRPEAQQGDDEMQAYLNSDFWFGQVLGGLTGKGPQLPGLADLQTNSMKDFNRGNPFPSDIKFYTYGANADSNHDGNISDAEADPLLPPDAPLGIFNRARQGTLLYHLLRDVSTVKLNEYKVPLIGTVYKRDLERVPTSNQINDLAVTNTSSQHRSQLQHFGPSLDPSDHSDDWLEKNHRNIKYPAVMDNILNIIRRDFPVN